jgi:hypothetical protein
MSANGPKLEGAAIVAFDPNLTMRGDHQRRKFFPGRVGEGLDLVSIQIADKPAIIVRILPLADARCAFVGSSTRKRRLMKPPYGLTVGRLEGNMDTAAHRGWPAIDRRFETKDNVGGTIVDRAVENLISRKPTSAISGS